MRTETMKIMQGMATPMWLLYLFLSSLVSHAYEIETGLIHSAYLVGFFASMGIWISIQISMPYFIKKKGGMPDPDACFIATAAYGTPSHEKLDTLRNFRDTKLNTNIIGRTFVTLYYVISPPIAQFVSNHEPLRWMIRQLINLVVFFIEDRS